MRETLRGCNSLYTPQNRGAARVKHRDAAVPYILGAKTAFNLSDIKTVGQSPS